MKTTVIGLGLIGGSFALSLKDKGLSDHIMGIERSEASARRALELGLVDEMVDLDQALEKSDLIVLATPVDTIPTLALKILNRIRHDQIVMDMGSIKQELCEMTMMHPNRGRLVATHPMWGTENSGPDAAQHGGFAGRTVVICERERSDDDAAATVEKIYRTLGMPIRYMSAEEQDMHCAYVSHISHISSYALALTVLNKERDERNITNLAAGGFDSTARLAKSSAEMWEPIFLENRQAILDVIDEYIENIILFKHAIKSGNGEVIRTLIRQANKVREVLDKGKK